MRPGPAYQPLYNLGLAQLSGSSHCTNGLSLVTTQLNPDRSGASLHLTGPGLVTVNWDQPSGSMKHGQTFLKGRLPEGGKTEDGGGEIKVRWLVAGKKRSKQENGRNYESRQGR